MLDLGHNQLTELPEELGELTGLRDFLYLHDNRLGSLPSSLQRLTRLRYLNISQNAFEEFPECVCGMTSLIELRVSDNPLTALPEALGRLAQLRELHLRNTKVAELPDSLGMLRELRHIDLRGNPLRALPLTLTGLPRLEARRALGNNPGSAGLAGRTRRARLRGLSLRPVVLRQDLHHDPVGDQLPDLFNLFIRHSNAAPGPIALQVGFPHCPWPLGSPCIRMSPPGWTPSFRARARSDSFG